MEDDPRWLPDPKGCETIRTLLMGPQRVVDRVMVLSLWSFPAKGLDMGHDTDGDEQVRLAFPLRLGACVRAYLYCDALLVL